MGQTYTKQGTMENYTPIALMASDEQDMEILSALLQDGLLPPTDMTYDAVQQVFTLVCARFIREITPSLHSDTSPYRVTTALYITEVTKVQRKNIVLADDIVPVTILSVLLNKDCIVIQCADDKAIRLQVTENFSAMVKDLDEPYPASVTPNHE